jgi:hypothetical protein
MRPLYNQIPEGNSNFVGIFLVYSLLCNTSDLG